MFWRSEMMSVASRQAGHCMTVSPLPVQAVAPSATMECGPGCYALRSPAKAVRLRRSEEHTSELQSPCNLVCRLLLEKKKRVSACASWGEGAVAAADGTPHLAGRTQTGRRRHRAARS